MEESQNQRLLYRPEEVQLLKRLKFENKNLSWAIIMEKYNSEVEPSRKRSEDGLSGKWKQMNKKKRNAKKKKARNNTKPTQDDAAHDFQYDAPISDELARLEMVNNLTQLDQICPFSPTAGFSMFSVGCK